MTAPADSAARPPHRTLPGPWVWAVQLTVGAVVALLVGRALVRNWSEFRSLHVAVAFQPGWLALSVLAVFATYAIQVESWRRVLAGWAQRLPYARALRIWMLVNLGRYVPGKIWSVAGLMVLAQRAGVDAWAAAASAVVIQALGWGNVNIPLFEAVKELIAKGIPVVISTRVWNGRVLPNYGFQGGGKTLQEAGAIFADNLSPQKARILLMLALQTSSNAQEIQRLFDK